MWQGCRVPLHLAFPEGVGKGEAGPEALLREVVGKARVELEAEGCRPLLEIPFASVSGAPPTGIADEYGLIVVTLERELRKDSPHLKWISEVKVPLMFVFV
jgi:hypothetical protein